MLNGEIGDFMECAPMMLKSKYFYSTKPAPSFTITEAIVAQCDGSEYDRGVLEAADATAKQTSQMLGKLISTLYDKGLLTADELYRLASDFEQA